MPAGYISPYCVRPYRDGINNNGRVHLSTRMAARRINSSQRVAWSCFDELVHYGLIVQTTPGVQGKKGRAARWRLTDVACANPDGTMAAPTKDYLNWDGVLYDIKPKRRKAQKVTTIRSQGVTTKSSQGVTTKSSQGNAQVSGPGDYFSTSDIDIYPSNCASAERKAKRRPKPSWQRNSKTADEQLEPEPAKLPWSTPSISEVFGAERDTILAEYRGEGRSLS
jgi:hypothetical protein